MKIVSFCVLLLSCFIAFQAEAQSPETIVLRQGTDESCVLSQHGTNFGFFMPETGGYLFTGVIIGEKSFWLHEAEKIRVSSKNKGWLVKITDPLLGKGILSMHVLPLSACNGIILEVTGKDLPEGLQFLWAYGGCSSKTDTTEKDFFFQPQQCLNNVFSREINTFTVYYGPSMRLKVMMGVGPLNLETRLSDARKMSSPLAFWQSGKKTDAPALAATNQLRSGERSYYCIYRQNQQADYNYEMLPAIFKQELTKNNNDHEEARPHTSFGPDFHF